MGEDIFRRALAAFKAGRKDEARSLLMDVVEQDAQHEQAWLFLSALVDSLEEQQICLENVLTINPNNAKAQQGLETLQRKLSGRQAPPPTSPEPDPWTSFAETASTPPIGAEQNEPSDDNLFGESAFGSFSAFSSGFDAPDETPDTAQETDDPFSWLNDTPAVPTDSERLNRPANSADWDRDSQPATYGSGRQIDEPTADDYDTWMDNLPLGADDETDSDVPSAFGAVQFGDSSFMVDEEDADDPFGSSGRGAQSPDFWDAPSTSSSDSLAPDDSFTAFGAQGSPSGATAQRRSEPASDDLFASAGGFADDEPDSGTFGRGLFETPEDSNAAYFDDLESDETDRGSSEFAFTFDDEENEDDMLQARLNAVTSSSPASTQAAPVAQPHVDYYRLIPADIEPAEGGISTRTMLLAGGIMLMLVLNVASFALLIM